MMRNVGIILKRNNPVKNQYSLLDQNEGIIICSIAREDICAGACIEYNLSKQGTRLFAEDVELIEFPCISTVADLLLLHRALEICFECMPVGSVTTGVFELIVTLYDDSMSSLLRMGLVKKIFLCKLFALLGFYPHEKKFQNQFFHSLATETLDNLKTFSLSMMQEEDIEAWLQSCMAMHMQRAKFKTRSLGKWVEML